MAHFASGAGELGHLRPSGTLMKFSPRKGYGFFRRDDGREDVFCHYSQLASGCFGDMIVGCRMVFDLGTNGRNGKQRAVNVTIVELPDGREEDSLRRPVFGEEGPALASRGRGERPEGPGNGRPPRWTGVLRKVVDDGTYGYIDRNDQTGPAFCHFPRRRGEGIWHPPVGSRLAFDLEPVHNCSSGHTNWRAVNIRVLGPDGRREEGQPLSSWRGRRPPPAGAPGEGRDRHSSG